MLWNASGPTAFAGDEKQEPNIILLMADDLGYGHLGCYGQEKIKTPHIDALARDGMRFTDAYSGSSVSAPGLRTTYKDYVK